MFKRFITILFLSGIISIEVEAQYDPSFSHYFDMEMAYNPAAAGKDPKLNFTAAYALDLAGFEHNPRSMYFAVDRPFYFLKSYHGVGLQFLNDQIGLFKHTRVSLQYAYKHGLFGGTLSAGVQVGLLSENFDGSKLDVGDSNDPALSGATLKGNGLDLAFGLHYIHGAWYVGVAGQHLNAPLIELGTTNELQIDRTYYLTGGYNIKLRNPFLTIKPSVLVRTDGTSWREDITTRLVYTNDKKIMYIGAGYSPSTSVTFLVGGTFHGFVVGYSYEMYTSSINPGNGSHELFVGYQHDINLVKKGRNKHKSVRIL